MSPVKFEENIKDKLGKRTIEPSKLAWNKLSDKLDGQEGKTDNKIIWWLGIAASLVGVFLVTTIFFSKSDKGTVTPILVENPIKEVVKTQEEKLVKTIVIDNEEPVQKEVNKLQEKAIINTIKKKEKREISIKRNTSSKPKTEIVANRISTKEVIEKEDLNNLNLTVKEVENQEIAAQIAKTGNHKVLVADAEIESLLQKAQKKIAVKGIKKGSTKTVDANLLLQDVETDLEKSFRDKIFNTIITSYNTVKTAVVERND